jgi:hypothetical protein
LEIPGLESEAESTPVESAKTGDVKASNTVNDSQASEPTFQPSGPVDDGIAPLDAEGIPQTGPDDAHHAPQSRLQAEPQLELPSSPESSEPAGDQPESPRKKNLWQKSTDKIRTLTKPEKSEPATDGATGSEKPPKSNWQLLKRSPQEPAKSMNSDPARQQMQMQQQQRLQQQRIDQQRADQQRLQQQQLQQQRLQMQRMEQQRQPQRRATPQQMPQNQLQNQPQSRWQSPDANQSYRGQATAKPGANGQTSRRQVQGATRPQYQQPQYQPQGRPQQGQKKRAVDPRSAEYQPHAPWDIQPGADQSAKPVARHVATRTGAGSQAARVNQRAIPR